MDKCDRKQRPMFYGLLAYFPDALREVAHVSWKGNEQHNPGEPLHWARCKSADDLDALTRHLTDRAAGEQLDGDGLYHLAKVAWRALAALQKELEEPPVSNDWYIDDDVKLWLLEDDQDSSV